ncbi:MAG: aminoacyltransferase, partial [Chloroflexi bacterium]|nr:aminoacyltransferase [Chloroflexota bacterium]
MADDTSAPIPFTVRRATLGDEHAWEQFTQRWGSFLQSWRWGELRRESGWQPVRFLAERDGALAGLIQGLYRRFYSSIAFVYVPRGPTVRDEAALIPLLEAVVREAQRLRAWFVRLEPELPQGHALGAQLTTAGWRSVPFHTQLPHTVRVDLRPDEATVLMSFRQTWRRFIRQATARSVTVREGTAADLPRFSALERETAERQHILGRSLAYYERFWRHFADHGARLWLAESEGLLLGALLVLEWA